MSMTVDALIAKAMSTSSEEEAIACLRKARKKNGGATVEYKGSTQSSLQEFEEQIGMPASELYRLAVEWQKYGKRCSEKISALQVEFARSKENTSYWKDKCKELELKNKAENKTDSISWKAKFNVLLAVNCLIVGFFLLGVSI